MIKSIAFFVYPITDMARSRKFYEDTLGLKLDTNFGDKWIEYDIAGGTFAITNMEFGHQPGAKGGAIAFEVDDLDKTVAQLKQKQVPFILDPMETPVCHMAVVADPDGNSVTIHKRKS
ncbi:VOC family protein [Pedosphaera parvula]|uniref:Glyoxalase/bleomycin resistance protein/dioxygenase n=1 Tax=Pedosphaera parvula (strain Ellin514) TaxID=320771 RepID=B9XMP0_PEDPL|nr:VOC family protein [Pedosphaera parvula]EEF58939.1 Glyoxalase/bleomycin resistance protein/dioxygenase [Pedosphaera parvula Ellin514]